MEPKYWMRQAYGRRVNKVPQWYHVTLMVGERVIGIVRLDPLLRVYSDSFMGWRIDRYITERRFCNEPLKTGDRSSDFRLAVDKARETASAIALWHAFDEHTAMENGRVFHEECGRPKGHKRGGWHFTRGQLFEGVLAARIRERQLHGRVLGIDWAKVP